MVELSWSRQQQMAATFSSRGSRSSGKIIKPGSEDEIQANFFAWIDLYKKDYPDLQLIFAIPNAGFASVRQGVLRKLTGRKPGVPDVCIPVIMWRNGQIDAVGLWIEFKQPRKKPTKEQLEWHDKLRRSGHRVEVCTSWTDAANILIEYLQLPLKIL